MSEVSLLNRSEPTVEEMKIYEEWKKMIASKGIEELDLTEEGKLQLECKEFIAWDEVKRKHGF